MALEILDSDKISNMAPIKQPNIAKSANLSGKRAAVVLYSYFPDDPRPRRAAEALVKEGMEIDLICLRDKKSDPRRETRNKINIFRVPFKRHRGGKVSYIFQYVSFILSSFFFLLFRSFRYRYDIVHVHNMPDVLVFSALIPKLLGAKVILDLHDPMPELMMSIFNAPAESVGVRLLKRLEKWSTGFANLVLTVNIACKNIFASRSCPSDKIQVIMNSPDESIFDFQPQTTNHQSEHLRSERPFIIMFHGSIVERHGLDLAVNAVEKLRTLIPNIQLRIYGQNTPFAEDVMKSVSQRNLQAFVSYHGSKTSEQISKLIDECDLGIIPNRRSIFTTINTPTRIFEYLSRGKPVIAPRVQGIQDYFGDQDLVYFELGDQEDLANKIQYIFKNPNDIKSIIKRGQDVYLAHTWKNEKQHLINQVSALINGK